MTCHFGIDRDTSKQKEQPGIVLESWKQPAPIPLDPPCPVHGDGHGTRPCPEMTLPEFPIEPTDERTT